MEAKSGAGRRVRRLLKSSSWKESNGWDQDGSSEGSEKGLFLNIRKAEPKGFADGSDVQSEEKEESRTIRQVTPRHYCLLVTGAFCNPLLLSVGWTQRLLLTNRRRRRWWDVASMSRLHNKVTSVLLADSLTFSACMLSWNKLPCWGGHVARDWGRPLANSQLGMEAPSPTAIKRNTVRFYFFREKMHKQSFKKFIQK